MEHGVFVSEGEDKRSRLILGWQKGCQIFGQLSQLSGKSHLFVGRAIGRIRQAVGEDFQQALFGELS